MGGGVSQRYEKGITYDLGSGVNGHEIQCQRVTVDIYKNFQLWVEPSSRGERDHFYYTPHDYPENLTTCEKVFTPGNTITLIYYQDDGKIIGVLPDQ